MKTSNKKWYLPAGLVAAVALVWITLVHAGVPIDQPPSPSQGPYWNTTLMASTVTAGGANATALVFPAITKVSGSTSYNGRNCLTRMVLQLGSGATFYLLDGSATSYTVYGLGLGSTGINTLNIAEEHLGPLCGTAGNSMTLYVASGTSANNAINAEGYTFFPYSANSGQ